MFVICIQSVFKLYIVQFWEQILLKGKIVNKIRFIQSICRYWILCFFKFSQKINYRIVVYCKNENIILIVIFSKKNVEGKVNILIYYSYLNYVNGWWWISVYYTILYYIIWYDIYF